MVSIDEFGGNPLLFVKSTKAALPRPASYRLGRDRRCLFFWRPRTVQGSELRLRPDDQRKASPGLNTFALYLD